MFNRRGNYIGDSDPNAEERFDHCSECGQMMDMDEEMSDGTCYSCIERLEEEQQEYNSDIKLERNNEPNS